MTASTDSKPVSVVLVHGGFVDGSGWEGVYGVLRASGYQGRDRSESDLSLAGDVDATRRVIDAQEGQALLVGHSYGGVVITEAGRNPKVAGLVYIAAFAPDTGESVRLLIKDPRRARRCRRSCHRRTVSCISTATSLPSPSPRMLSRTRRPSWRIRRFRGGSTALSRSGRANRPGSRSRAGIWWRPKTE